MADNPFVPRPLSGCQGGLRLRTVLAYVRIAIDSRTDAAASVHFAALYLRRMTAFPLARVELDECQHGIIPSRLCAGALGVAATAHSLSSGGPKAGPGGRCDEKSGCDPLELIH
jgi:hypothetical protein